MKEQLILFETAKLAKKKDFGKDFKTDWCYSSDNDGLHKANFDNSTKTSPNELFLAPTQSLLQKWLREIKFIIITVIPIYNNSELRGFYFTLNDTKTYYFKIFSKYEEALEIGLQKALKLI